MKGDVSTPSSSRSLTRLTGNPDNKPLTKTVPLPAI